MYLDIETNPNCKTNGLFAFESLGDVRPVKGVFIEKKGEVSYFDVVGVGKGPQFVRAYAQKISDSGLGVGYLIYGDSWGIRLRPKSSLQEPWNLHDKNQFGEAYMIYGSEEDIVFGE